MEVEIPESLNWFVERLLTSKRLTLSRHELETHWSLEDAEASHAALDVWEELESLANEPQQD